MRHTLEPLGFEFFHPCTETSTGGRYLQRRFCLVKTSRCYEPYVKPKALGGELLGRWEARMPQTVISVVLEVQPASADILSRVIDGLREVEEAPPTGFSEKYGRLKASVPALHFMSMTIFKDGQYDPIFALEANFDGPAGPFWAALEDLLGNELRQIVRCCKPPSDNTRELYDAVTDSKVPNPIAPYLETKTLTPAAFHVGNRGWIASGFCARPTSSLRRNQRFRITMKHIGWTVLKSFIKPCAQPCCRNFPG
jgi:hypothetical protein